MTQQYIDLPASRSPEALAALQAGMICLHTAAQCQGLENAIADGKLPRDFVTAMNGWWDAYEHYLKVISNSAPFACKAGCWACCMDNPRGNTGVELLWLYLGIRNRQDYFQLARQLVSKAAAFEQVLQKNELDLAKSQYDWKKGRNRCVFLQDDNRCGVYEFRPVACRMFVSLTDPDWCDLQHPKAQEAVNPHLEPPKPMRKLLIEISTRLGVEALPSDLFRGMAWLIGYVLQHSSIEVES